MSKPQLSGLYKHSLTERANLVAEWANLNAEEQAALLNGLPLAMGDGLRDALDPRRQKLI